MRDLISVKMAAWWLSVVLIHGCTPLTIDAALSQPKQRERRQLNEFIMDFEEIHVDEGEFSEVCFFLATYCD